MDFTSVIKPTLSRYLTDKKYQKQQIRALLETQDPFYQEKFNKENTRDELIKKFVDHCNKVLVNTIYHNKPLPIYKNDEMNKVIIQLRQLLMQQAQSNNPQYFGMQSQLQSSLLNNGQYQVGYQNRIPPTAAGNIFQHQSAQLQAQQIQAQQSSQPILQYAQQTPYTRTPASSLYGNVPHTQSLYAQQQHQLHHQQQSQLAGAGQINQSAILSYPPQMQTANIQQPDIIRQQLNQQRQLAQQQQSNPSCICGIPQLKNDQVDPNFTKCINKNCRQNYHYKCLGISDQELSSQKAEFECPNCVLKKIDPLNEVQEILVQPQILKKKSISTFNVFLTEENLSKLRKKTESYAIEIRCIRLDYKYFHEITWPDFFEIQLEDKRIIELKPLQQNSSLKKRKDEKLVFKDEQINFFRAGMNKITFIENFPKESISTLRITPDASYFFGVFLIKRLKRVELIQQINQKNVIDQFTCKDKIIDQFQSSQDIQLQSLNTTIFCSLDMNIIGTPCRGRFCQHLQCFSLENFLIVTEQMIPRKWKCPICKKKSYDMVIDGYLVEILKQIKGNKIHQNVTDIKFLPNGTYELISNKNLEVMEIEDNDDFESQAIKERQRQQEEELRQKQLLEQELKKKLASVIVISDDEDDVPANLKPVAQQPQANEKPEQQNEKSENQEKKDGQEKKEKAPVTKLPPQVYEFQKQNQQVGQKQWDLTRNEYQLIENNNDKNLSMIKKLNPDQVKEEPIEQVKKKKELREELLMDDYFYIEKAFDDFCKDETIEKKDKFDFGIMEFTVQHKIIRYFKKQYNEIFQNFKRETGYAPPERNYRQTNHQNGSNQGNSIQNQQANVPNNNVTIGSVNNISNNNNIDPLNYLGGDPRKKIKTNKQVTAPTPFQSTFKPPAIDMSLKQKEKNSANNNQMQIEEANQSKQQPQISQNINEQQTVVNEGSNNNPILLD